MIDENTNGLVGAGIGFVAGLLGGYGISEAIGANNATKCGVAVACAGIGAGIGMSMEIDFRNRSAQIGQNCNDSCLRILDNSVKTMENIISIGRTDTQLLDID